MLQGTNNIIAGNYIGTDIEGTTQVDTALGTGKPGIAILTPGNFVLDNVVVGHSPNIEVRGAGQKGASEVMIQGNRVGVDAEGKKLGVGFGGGIECLLNLGPFCPISAEDIHRDSSPGLLTDRGRRGK